LNPDPRSLRTCALCGKTWQCALKCQKLKEKQPSGCMCYDCFKKVMKVQDTHVEGDPTIIIPEERDLFLEWCFPSEDNPSKRIEQ